jgi:anthranilate synthase/aminodeoxychorismate synthase-like glutamine amidotransferase
MRVRVLVLDHHDSFTFNLVALLEELGARCDVLASDSLDWAGVAAHPADGLVLSPGPCSPREAGVSVEVAARSTRPVLGVCLGHQAIASAMGAEIVRATRPVHGKTDRVLHDGRGLFEGVPQGFLATRYHSLAVREASLPSALEVAARSHDGTVMALRHLTRPIDGVQFHPESFLSEHGATLAGNWLRRVEEARA